MPSAMPSRRTEQCVFYDPETKRRCRRNGTGSPPLCQRCRDELDEREKSPFAEILGSLFMGRRPSQRSVEEAVRTAMEGLSGKRMSDGEFQDLFAKARAAAASRGQSPPSGSSSSSGSGARSQSTREQERDEAERARQISWARRTLGFTAKESLDEATIKKRFRAMALKHHPDRGGSTAKMAELNRAVEILSAPG